MSPSAPAASARACLVLAAVLWSLGSLFVRFLREPTALGLHDPPLTPLQIAFFRGLFGGLVLLTLVRRTEVAVRPVMGAMVLTFTVMSGLYMSALSLGPAANAIFLQNTAPVWVYLFAVYALGEAGNRRGWQAVLLGGLGAVVIVAGNWPRDLPPDEQQTQVVILPMGVGSGMWYAGVVLFLRVLRHESPAWLIALNLLGTAAVLGVYVIARFGVTGFLDWVTVPTAGQFALLAVFGVVQLATPYWLFARGLRSVSPHEKDTPTPAMWAGGALIFAALVWRYVPDRRGDQPTPQPK